MESNTPQRPVWKFNPIPGALYFPMTINILGCGPSAKSWNRQGYSIGVNDCFAIHPVDILVVVNSFSGKGDRQRLTTIEQSKPTFFLSHSAKWKRRPDYRKIEMKQFQGHVDAETFYHNDSSTPFIAATIAVAIGAKRIVLWGVDYENHPIINGSALEREVNSWRRLNDAIAKFNSTIYLGTNYGALKSVIPHL